MIDLHCHMLPGVDDGSASEADSLEMGRIAARSGVTAIALTPHCNLPEGQGNYYDGALETRFRRLAMLFRQEGLPVTLYRGMEVFSTPELPRLLDEERLLTLGGSRYLLVEFAFGETPWFAAQTLESIAAQMATMSKPPTQRMTSCGVCIFALCSSTPLATTCRLCFKSSLRSIPAP